MKNHSYALHFFLKVFASSKIKFSVVAWSASVSLHSIIVKTLQLKHKQNLLTRYTIHYTLNTNYHIFGLWWFSDIIRISRQKKIFLKILLLNIYSKLEYLTNCTEYNQNWQCSVTYDGIRNIFLHWHYPPVVTVASRVLAAYTIFRHASLLAVNPRHHLINIHRRSSSISFFHLFFVARKICLHMASIQTIFSFLLCYLSFACILSI